MTKLIKAAENYVQASDCITKGFQKLLKEVKSEADQGRLYIPDDNAEIVALTTDQLLQMVDARNMLIDAIKNPEDPPAVEVDVKAEPAK